MIDDVPDRFSFCSRVFRSPQRQKVKALRRERRDAGAPVSARKAPQRVKLGARTGQTLTQKIESQKPKQPRAADKDKADRKAN